MSVRSHVYLEYFSFSSDSSKVLQKAVEAEEECFSQFGSECSEAYRDRIRTLFLNLKDKSNPELKLRILSGSLEVSIFCVMTPEEMKSKERQEEEEKLREENLFKARGAQPQEAETDMFKCGKCKQRKCRYYQMQTRSADEPMVFTVLIFCF